MDAFFNLAILFARIGQYNKAEKFFGKVVESNPPYLDKALFNLALVRERQGKYDKSIENLRQAIAVEPNNARAREYFQRLIGRGITVK